MISNLITPLFFSLCGIIDFDTGRVTRMDMEQDEEEDGAGKQKWYRKIFNIIA